MKSAAILFWCITQSVFALTPEEIRKIAAEPHDRANLVEALKIYPNAREYKVSQRFRLPDGEFYASPASVVKEKVVRGRYLVSELKLPQAEASLVIVVTYEEELDLFRKWVLLPDGAVVSSTGVSHPKQRTIAWVSDKSYGDPPTSVLAIETHADDKSTWKEVMMQNGKVSSVNLGSAEKVK